MQGINNVLNLLKPEIGIRRIGAFQFLAGNLALICAFDLRYKYRVGKIRRILIQHPGNRPAIG